ncbi:MAG: hypothetical protein ABIH00_04415 [Armatimonadota bacterium]
MKKYQILIIVLASILVILSGPIFPEKAEPKQTNFTAYLSAKITGGKNVLYCTTFQLAWDVLAGDVIKQKEIVLSGSPRTAQELNKRLTGKEDVSADSYIAMAGYKKENIIGKINNALKKKFGKDAPKLDKNELINPEDVIAYAYLYKNLEFENKFESLKDPVLFGDKKVSVNAFGIEKMDDGEKYLKAAKQVSILHYKDGGSFVISLKSKSADDEIILAVIDPGKTLLDTVNSMNKLIDAGKRVYLQKGDTLQIPKLDFDIKHDYKELENRAVLNKGFEGYMIAKAVQSIRFRLNEEGALLKSEAKITMVKSAIMLEEPKKLIFDKPFLVCLKEKAAQYPYLAIWVDNPEILLKK